MTLARPGDHRRLVALLWTCLLAPGCRSSAEIVPRARSGVRGPWPAHVLDRGYVTRTVLMRDFDGDGDEDVLASDADAHRVYFLAGPAHQRVTIATGVQPIHAQDFDVDGDGDLDFVGVDYRPGQVFWLENPGVRGGADEAESAARPWPLRFIDRASQQGADGLHAVIVVDVDGDGKRDVLATSNAPNGEVANSIVWYPVPADPRGLPPDGAWPRRLVADGDATGFVHYLAFGDLDGDGRKDVVTGAKVGRYFAWWRAPDAPQAPDAHWQKHLLPGVQKGATNVELADVNGDGVVDLVGARGHGKGLLWYRGPKFSPVPIDDALEGPHSLAVADIDGDGDADIATVANDSHVAAWFENDGRGGFQRHVIAADQRSYDIRLLDADHDGDLDLLVAGEKSRNVVWYENPGRAVSRAGR